jgi:hypothetical protein
MICLLLFCFDQAAFGVRVPRVVADCSRNLTTELKAMFDLESRERKKTTWTNLPISMTSVQQ